MVLLSTARCLTCGSALLRALSAARASSTTRQMRKVRSSSSLMWWTETPTMRLGILGMSKPGGAVLFGRQLDLERFSLTAT